jgi:hypothetical protein
MRETYGHLQDRAFASRVEHQGGNTLTRERRERVHREGASDSESHYVSLCVPSGWFCGEKTENRKDVDGSGSTLETGEGDTPSKPHFTALNRDIFSSFRVVIHRLMAREMDAM